MNDDWRLRIDLRESGPARRLGEMLDAEEIEHDLRRSFRDRVVVSVSEGEVFCYAGSREQAERAEALIRRLAADHQWTVDVELTRWHPVAQRWEDPDAADAAVATGAEGLAEEREERVEEEREASAQQGYPEMEVRVQCATRAAAGELSQRLAAEGIPHLHRHRYLLIGVTDEDAGQALVQRLRDEVPEGATVALERNRRAIYDHRVWSPFAVLGGLGG